MTGELIEPLFKHHVIRHVELHVSIHADVPDEDRPHAVETKSSVWLVFTAMLRTCVFRERAQTTIILPLLISQSRQVPSSPPVYIHRPFF
ncbi:hypothetical protein GCK72_022851 [Caenorhabditis remanei]|uniref:Uncharacterized protein n=1 Tax=Caenorhabditis remanei TaxID=31234 RepID=A0A6A5FUY9_CAERE|nr:hypothetical protein GCK72_022851 [Caenorhabditis remanei]KAF1746397.1 hypothetical protein GCK72_022851 [Caenorhabditis remanei]